MLTAPVSAVSLPGESIPGVLMGEDLQVWADQSLPDLAGEEGEWYAIALCQGDFSVDLTKYAVALTAFFSEEERQNPVERQRCALALLAMGIEQPAGQTAQETIGKQGVMSVIFGLHLLQNGAVCSDHSAYSVAEQLVSLQLADGGWAVSGQYGDVDVTAMALQALAMQKDTWVNAIDRGVAFLQSKQLPDGGFKSYGVSNSESVSQVIIALTALGMDPRNEESFPGILQAWERFRLEDGRFAHVLGGEANGHACAQALLAYVAMWRLENNLEGLYAFSLQKTNPPQVSMPPETSVDTESSAEGETVSFSTSHTHKQEEGMSPARLAILVLCIITAIGSGIYLLWPKR